MRQKTERASASFRNGHVHVRNHLQGKQYTPRLISCGTINLYMGGGGGCFSCNQATAMKSISALMEKEVSTHAYVLPVVVLLTILANGL
jgi:hypothetical protein